MRKLKREQHFYLGKSSNTARLYLRKTFSNIFLTLTDWSHRTIICKTSGGSKLGSNSKRRKRSPFAIENIVRELNVYLKLYKITRIYLILKMRISAFFYFLTKELAFYGVDIIKLRIRRPIAFNGVRGRKLRRL